MDSVQSEPSSSPPPTTTEIPQSASTGKDGSSGDTSSILSASGLSSWTRNLRISSSSQEDSQQGNSVKSTLARFTSGFNLRSSPKSPVTDESSEGQGASTTVQSGVFGSLTKGIVDSSKSAVKAVQVKARHMVSQNKRRYQVIFSYLFDFQF